MLLLCPLTWPFGGLIAGVWLFVKGAFLFCNPATQWIGAAFLALAF